MTRARSVATEPTEGETAEAPGTIPEGVDADVTVNELSPDERAKRIALLAAKLQKNAV